jgi:hypothetical protein
VEWYHITGFFKSIWILGILDKGRGYFWKLLFSTLFRRPRLLPLSVMYSVYGFHFRKIAEKLAVTPARQSQSSG